jgi:hypothetical protein
MNKLWSESELNSLQEFYPKYGIKFCAEKLNRSCESVRTKARRLNLSAPGSKTRTHEEYELEILNKELDLQPLEAYISKRMKILHECIEGHHWKAAPENILRGHGCPICDKINKTKSHEQYCSEISFEVLEPYINAHTHISHKCGNNHIWSATPNAILAGSGCPTCAPSGFNRNKPAILYYVKISSYNEIYYKIGITNNSVIERFKNDKDKNILSIRETYFELGLDAELEERRLLQKYTASRQHIQGFLRGGGNTELFEYDILGLENNS